MPILPTLKGLHFPFARPLGASAVQGRCTVALPCLVSKHPCSLLMLCMSYFIGHRNGKCSYVIQLYCFCPATRNILIGSQTPLLVWGVGGGWQAGCGTPTKGNNQSLIFACKMRSPVEETCNHLGNRVGSDSWLPLPFHHLDAR